MTDQQTIRSLDPLKEAQWDLWTASNPAASFFHSSQWARVLRASYGHESHYLAETDGERPCALLPILEVNSSLKGRRGVALPFSDECGLLCFNGADGRRLIDAALELGRQRQWKYFELRGDIPIDPCPNHWRSYAGHAVDLTVGADKLFVNLESSVRRAIRKAEKAGVIARVLDTIEATRAFYALHCRTRRKHGVPPQPIAFFLNLHEHAFQQGKGFIVAAEHEGRTIAASVFVHHGKNALYKFGASDRTSLRLRANDLVMWEAMKWYATRCYSVLSMGRTALGNDGLRRFKRGFGAMEKSIKYFRYDFGRRTFVTGHDEKPDFVNKLFALTPLPVLRIVGQGLYRHLD